MWCHGRTRQRLTAGRKKQNKRVGAGGLGATVGDLARILAYI